MIKPKYGLAGGLSLASPFYRRQRSRKSQIIVREHLKPKGEYL
uniref:Uncharacterized protein n=1 Tax=Siphoviridae sp. ctMgg26 TaxID=2825462 RepID=A0A8S5PZZ1_9CAUD|nr:MAG TPA: hypothetical protein [Siphoviridae sp. ctMgg26]